MQKPLPPARRALSGTLPPQPEGRYLAPCLPTPQLTRQAAAQKEATRGSVPGGVALGGCWGSRSGGSPPAPLGGRWALSAAGQAQTRDGSRCGGAMPGRAPFPRRPRTHSMETRNWTVSSGCGTPGRTASMKKLGRKIRSCGPPSWNSGYLRGDDDTADWLTGRPADRHPPPEPRARPPPRPGPLRSHGPPGPRRHGPGPARKRRGTRAAPGGAAAAALAPCWRGGPPRGTVGAAGQPLGGLKPSPWRPPLHNHGPARGPAAPWAHAGGYPALGNPRGAARPRGGGWKRLQNGASVGIHSLGGASRGLFLMGYRREVGLLL